MSAPLFPADVRFSQRLFSCAGLYRGELDGEWGPKTDAAAYAWDKATVQCRELMGRFDGRTEAVLATTLPEAQRIFRSLLIRLRASLDARAISGTRTYEEQARLYNIGRYGSHDGTVTNAAAGHSNHNFGIAIDIGIFKDGRYLAESPLYDKAGEVAGAEAGIEWGGAWATFQDRPHFQVATGLSIAEVRAAFEAGKPFLKAEGRP